MKSEEAYSILDIVSESEGQGVVLTRSGSICVSFELREPECYSLTPEDIDRRDGMFREAFKFLPDGTYVHKQDVFLKERYCPDIAGGSFLDRADARHFRGRLYVSHTCVMHFVLSGLKSLEKAYISSPLSYKENLHKEDLARLDEFLEGVDNAVGIIRSMRDTEIAPMSGQEMRDFTAGYTTLFDAPGAVVDIHADTELRTGKKRARCFAVCDEIFLPDGSLDSCVRDDSLPPAGSLLYHPMLERLGMYLPYNHIVNQVVFFEGNGRLRERIARNIDIYGSNSGMSRSIKVQYQKLDELQQEILEENETLVRSFFSVCVFDESEAELEKADKKIRETLNLARLGYYIPGYENLAAVHFACVPGQIHLMPRKYLFLTTLPIALCFFLQCGSFRNDSEGIYVHDRMYQVPLRKDIWDAGKKRVNARNGMVIAGTGGGKSAFTLNLTQQLIEQDYTVVVVEFTKDESEKEVALTRFIQDYYENVREGHNFESFYNHVTEHYPEILARKHIPKDYFSLESFSLNCGEFLPGRRYENVCKDTGTDFSGKKFIVFELTQIKQDRFLSNLVMGMIFTVIQKKLLSDRRKRGVLIFDEYGETAQMVDTATGTGIHSSVAFCYQKIRKENGAVYTIIQNPDQLPENEHTKNIIANTDMLFVLPTKEVIYQSVIDRFRLTHPGQIALMKSMRNSFSGQRPYSECFMRLGEHYATVTRLEFSREKFLAFQTEGEIWSDLEEKNRRMSMEDAIEEYIREHQ